MASLPSPPLPLSLPFVREVTKTQRTNCCGSALLLLLLMLQLRLPKDIRTGRIAPISRSYGRACNSQRNCGSCSQVLSCDFIRNPLDSPIFHWSGNHFAAQSMICFIHSVEYVAWISIHILQRSDLYVFKIIINIALTFLYISENEKLIIYKRVVCMFNL